MHPIDKLEREMGKARLPAVHIGDTVEVHYLIREGDKERVQLFIGTIIAMTGRGLRRSITVRRIVQGEGVERIFPLHSPRVAKIEIVRHGKARRAKLYYLRDRVGKSRRLADRSRGLQHIEGVRPGEGKKKAAKPAKPGKQDLAVPGEGDGGE
jgi:large subunit ribosomal protein L19